MELSIPGILGGSVAETFTKVVGLFKLSPEKKAEFQAAIDENKAVLDQKGLEIEGKIEDSISKEIESAASIIMAEAKSESWLPRNVRPLLLLMWGSVITFNPIAAIVSQFTSHPITPIVLDPWIYKLTAIGFTGYVTARSIDKYHKNKAKRAKSTK